MVKHPLDDQAEATRYVAFAILSEAAHFSADITDALREHNAELPEEAAYAVHHGVRSATNPSCTR